MALFAHENSGLTFLEHANIISIDYFSTFLLQSGAPSYVRGPLQRSISNHLILMLFHQQPLSNVPTPRSLLKSPTTQTHTTTLGGQCCYGDQPIDFRCYYIFLIEKYPQPLGHNVYQFYWPSATRNPSENGVQNG